MTDNSGMQPPAQGNAPDFAQPNSPFAQNSQQGEQQYEQPAAQQDQYQQPAQQSEQPQQTQPQQDFSAPEPAATNRPQPEQLVMEWEAPNRPFKQRNRQYYVTIFAIMLLISLILFFAGQFLPIAVVFALGFLAYVSAAVPPEQVIHQISTYGVRTGDQLYLWEELGRYWYEERFGQKMVKIEVSRFPNQLMMLLGTVTEEEMTQILGEILLNERPALTQFEKGAQWLQEKIPLDPEA